MENYTFITENFTTGPAIYYVISTDRIETLKVHETYGAYRQPYQGKQDDEDTVEGFNYYDGYNMRTITIKQEYYEPSHNLEEDQDLIKELNEAIENMVLVKEAGGYETYKGGRFSVTKSHFQTEFARFELVENDDLDDNEESKDEYEED